MKKFFTALLVCFCTEISFAQNLVGQAGKTVAQGLPDVPAKVAQALAKNGVASSLVPVQITNLPAAISATQAWVAVPTSEIPAAAQALSARVLPVDELRQAVSNDRKMKLYVPSALISGKYTLYRGLRLQNTDELQNILTHGMEIDKTHHHTVFVSPNISVALGYMFPHQTARLLGTFEEEALPVMIKIPVTQQLLRENSPQKPQEEFGGRRVFYQDVPAEQISDVFVFLEVNNQLRWYKAVVEQGQLIFIPVPSKALSGWLAD